MSVGRFLAGIGALIRDPESHKYLLLKRSDDKDFAAGAWECVTGRVDQGESFEDAVQREVFEELGVRVELLAILGTTHFYRGEPRPENELLGVVYACRLRGKTGFKISHEHSEYRWVSAGEAISLLGNEHPSEHWLKKVIERAEITLGQLPGKLLELHLQEGFELDT